MQPRSAKYAEEATKALAIVERLGFGVEVARRFGAFNVLWTMLETQLETTVWAMRGYPAPDTRPETDRSTIQEWIIDLGTGTPKFSPEANLVLKVASRAANDLMEYRHALAHGYLIPSETMPTFIRNPEWGGVRRKRLSNDGHVSENLMNMALACVLFLIEIVSESRNAASLGYRDDRLRRLAGTANDAQSLASELRHLTTLVNDENY